MKEILSGDYDTVKKHIIDIYSKEEVCMGEILANVRCIDLTMEEQHELYMELMTEWEHDVFILLNVEEHICRKLK